MRALAFSFSVLFLATLPSATLAAVTINEVAWMGTAVSANHEWIELRNDGASESVDGWVLSDGANLEITLSGSIPAGAFAVLERTSDDSAPGTAFLIYTGAMVNTGSTLTLRRPDGSLIDQVAGGENWSAIGGDNVTKETAQLTNGGWVTAIATPGSQNTTETTREEEEEEEDVVEEVDDHDGGGGGTVVTTRSATKEPLKLEPSAPTVTIAMPGQVYVNQEVRAKATVGNIGKVLAQSMVRSWNFGDLHTAAGEEVTHRFAYPGEYIVSVEATYKDYVATDRVVVTVLPLTLSVTRNSAGDVQLHNDSKYEVDVSEHVVVGERSITIPNGTFLRPKATLTIPMRELLRTDRPILVYDSARRLVAHTGEVEPELVYAATTRQLTAAAAAALPIANAPDAPSTFRFGVSAPTTTTMKAATTSSATRQEAADVPPSGSVLGAAASTAATPVYPYLGLIALIGIALAAVVAGRSTKPAAEPVYQGVASEVDDFPFR